MKSSLNGSMRKGRFVSKEDAIQSVEDLVGFQIETSANNEDGMKI